MQYTESERLFEASKKCILGGVNSPVRAYQAVHRTPVFVERASGSHIYDVDGNAYIDYVSGTCLSARNKSRAGGVRERADIRGADRKGTKACRADPFLYPVDGSVQTGKFRNGGDDERHPCGERIYGTG